MTGKTNNITTLIGGNKKIEDKKIPNSLDDFLYWETDDIIPMHVFASYYGKGTGSLAEEVRNIDPAEFSKGIYYLIDYEMVGYEVKVNNVLKKTNSPELKAYKVVDNLLSYAIFEISKDELDKIGFLGNMKSGCRFKLPKIPLAMVEKMDLFFRTVHEKYHSESIVLLTYNPKVGGSQGWDILVPKQSNNAGHCNYDPSSVSDLHDTDTFIVGSAHSHPLMSAYASGTDHDDQADFDGLHITYGWSHATNMRTEYYAEIQVQDQSWPIETELIFALPEVQKKDVPKELLDLIEEKVAEEKPSVTQWNHGSSSYGSYSNGYKPDPYATTIKHIPQKNLIRHKNYLETLGSPVVVGITQHLLDGGQCHCPFCDTVLVVPEINYRRCLSCTGYVMDGHETLSDMVQARQNLSLATYELSESGGALVKDVYLWDATQEKSDDAFTLAIQAKESDTKK